MAKPLLFKNINDLIAILEKIGKLGKSVEITEELIANHLTIDDVGNTYFLTDIISAKSKDDKKLSHLHFKINNDKSLSLKEIHQAHEDKLHIDFLTNKLLANILWLIYLSLQNKLIDGNKLKTIIPRYLSTFNIDNSTICPLTRSPLVVAVLDNKGNNFEWFAIVKAIDTTEKNPIDNLPLSKDDLVANNSLNSFINLQFRCLGNTLERFTSLQLKQSIRNDTLDDTITSLRENLEDKRKHVETVRSNYQAPAKNLIDLQNERNKIQVELNKLKNSNLRSSMTPIFASLGAIVGGMLVSMIVSMVIITSISGIGILIGFGAGLIIGSVAGLVTYASFKQILKKQDKKIVLLEEKLNEINQDIAKWENFTNEQRSYIDNHFENHARPIKKADDKKYSEIEIVHSSPISQPLKSPVQRINREISPNNPRIYDLYRLSRS